MSFSLGIWAAFAIIVIIFVITALLMVIYCTTGLLDNLVWLLFDHRQKPSKPANCPHSRLDFLFPATLSWKTCYLIAVGYASWFLLLTLIFYLFIASPLANGTPRDSFGDFLQHQLYINDARHYYELAQWGYNNPLDGLDSLAFFPLYPLTLFIIHQLIPVRYEIIGLGLNIVLLGLIIKYLYQFAYRKLSPLGAGLTTVLLLVFPVSFFLIVPGTTTIFILLTLLVFIALEQKKFSLASLMAFLASLARVQGFLLGVSLFIFALAGIKRDKSSWLIPRRNLILSFSPLVGLGLYFCINYMVAGDPLAFLTRQTDTWSNSLQNPILTIYSVVQTMFSFSLAVAVGRWGLVLFCFLVICFTICCGVKQKFPQCYLVYLFAYFLLSFSISNPMSGGRFTLMLWPLFIIQAHFLLRHQKLIPPCLLGYLTLLPLMWYFYCFYNGFVVC